METNSDFSNEFLPTLPSLQTSTVKLLTEYLPNVQSPQFKSDFFIQEYLLQQPEWMAEIDPPEWIKKATNQALALAIKMRVTKFPGNNLDLGHLHILTTKKPQQNTFLVYHAQEFIEKPELLNLDPTRHTIIVQRDPLTLTLPKETSLSDSYTRSSPDKVIKNHLGFHAVESDYLFFKYTAHRFIYYKRVSRSMTDQFNLQKTAKKLAEKFANNEIANLPE